MSRRHTSALQRQRQILLQGAWDLVPPIARRYAQASPEPFEDLLQVGLLGLVTAADRYRADAAVPFDCYARPHIRGAILHHLRDRAWLVRLPRRQAERAFTQKSWQQAGDARQHPPCEALQRWAALVRAASLEDLGLAGETAELDQLQTQANQPCDGEETYAPAPLHPSWKQGTTRELLAPLKRRERTVVQLVVLEGFSYRQVADRLKVSAPTVQRMLHRGLAHLRTTLQQRRINCRLPRRAASAAPEC